MSELQPETLTDLEDDEGWRATPYPDSLGYLTIGYGFLIDPRKHEELPREAGDAWLKAKAEGNWSELLALEPSLQYQPASVQRALQNMAYQLGASGVAAFKDMMDALKRGNLPAARQAALNSLWAKQTPSRAHRIADLIFTAP